MGYQADDVCTQRNIEDKRQLSNEKRGWSIVTVRHQIIVVGGYGTVGQHICHRLLEYNVEGAYEIIAAGRNEAQAIAFSKATNGIVQPLQWDVSAPQPQWPDLSKVRLIMMCLDMTDTQLVEYCLNHGIDYLDITANGDFLHQIEQLNRKGIATYVSESSTDIGKNKYPNNDQLNVSSTAIISAPEKQKTERSSTVLLSVGLAPGLTNLLAAELHRRMEQTKQLDISIMLGLGERHGQAAIRWTVDQLAKRFTVMEKGVPVQVHSFTDERVVSMLCNSQQEEAKNAQAVRQYVYRFPFSDQQTLVHTLGVTSISTRLGFDSVPLTRLLAGIQRIGILRLLHRSVMKKAVTALFGMIHMGSDRYGIRVDAIGHRAGQPVHLTCILNGNNQSHITAEVAALAAQRLLQQPYNTVGGVLHIEQVLDWSDVQTLQHKLALEFEWLEA